VVAGSVNLQYRNGGIGNIESYVQSLYAYDVRTEILGSKGAIFIGSLEKTPAVFLNANGSTQTLADHFLTRFADAYLAEVRDFVQNLLQDKPVGVTGEDGLKALATAVAAETSYRQRRPVKVSLERSAAT
jgi:predicted dehydrogenase